MAEEFEIPKEKWYHIIDRLTRIDEQLEVLIRINEAILKHISSIRLEKKIELTPVLITRRQFNNRYWTFEVDLSEAHTDYPIGIRETIGRPVNFACVIRLDSPASWKRNSKGNPLEELSVGYTVEDFEIEELYITNDASTGKLVVLVEWIE